MIQKTILILLLASISFNASAQIFNSTKIRLKKADKAFNDYQYEKAIPLYLKVLDDQYDNKVVQIKLAECYRKTENWTEAEYWYGQIVHFPSPPSLHLLYYGKALLINGKCELAKVWFEEYLKREPDDFRGPLLAKACQEDGISHPNFFCKNCYEITPLPFNTKYDDNSPVFYKKKLVYASEDTTNRYLEDISIKNFTNLYQISIDTLDEEHFEYIYNEASIFFDDEKKDISRSAFNSDYSQTYFTQKEKIDINQSISKIHIAKRIDNYWQQVETLPFNSELNDWSVLHPALADNDQRIYFASDMPGGFGGMDLYYADWLDNQWSNPINLGPIVNTEENEVYPYYHPTSNLLYFSSNGHIPNQGLDIYSTNPTENFNKITHLPAPVNSKYDDHGIIFNKNQTFAYFASNRIGGQGQDDIYGIRINVVHIKMNIVDKKYQEAIPEVIISSNGIDGKIESNKKGEILFSINSNDCKTFIIKKEGFQPVEKMICTKDLAQNSTLEITIELIED